MTHRWEVVAAEVRARVARGEHGAGGDIGTEEQLGDEFDVSRITIRRALTALRDEGLLVAGRGRGWRVAAASGGDPIGWFRITTGDLAGPGETMTTEILTFETVPAPPDLGTLAAGPALRTVSLSSVGAVAFDLTEVTFAAPYAETISRRELRETPPARLLAAKGCAIGRTDQFVTAAVATELDEPLGVEPGDPLLVVQRTVHDAAEHAVLRTIHRNPGRCTRIELTFPTTDQSGAPPVRVVRDR